jgi:hypothetical protein
MQFGKQGKASQMVKVAMGEQYKIELPVGDEIVTGKGLIPCVLWMQPRIHRKMKRPYFAVSAVGSDSTMGIKIGNSHELDGGGEESMGTSMRKGFSRTWTLLPISSIP